MEQREILAKRSNKVVYREGTWYIRYLTVRSPKQIF